MFKLEDYKKNNETFNYLMSTLTDTIKGWDYFVNWNKVNSNINNVEIHLNILNYLIGKENIKEEFTALIKQYSQVISVLPILVASRESDFNILKVNKKNGIEFEVANYDFRNKVKLTDEYIEKIYEFVEKSGILEIITKRKVKNLVDYVMGIEVGLDSNGRKNRSGTAMESLVELFVENLCKEKNFEYMTQATANSIKAKWGRDVVLDKASRRFDVAINTPNNLYLIETNYYSGGGSKLKATAGEFKTVQDIIDKNGYKFIWITDGKGWGTAKRSLQEAFEHNEYILNLSMVKDGVLNNMIK